MNAALIARAALIGEGHTALIHYCSVLKELDRGSRDTSSGGSVDLSYLSPFSFSMGE